MTKNGNENLDADRATADLTRRTVLGGAAVALGLGAGTLMATQAWAKTSQQEAKYQDKPQGQAKCSGCTQFQGPDACKIVDGKISPDGWCQLYSPKQG